MRDKWQNMVAAACLALAVCPAVLAQPAESATSTATAFDERAAQLADVINGNIAFSDYFAPSFRAAIPQSQFEAMTAGLLAQYGRAVIVESAASPDGRSGTLQLRFEKGVATILLDAGKAPDTRVTGLRLTGFLTANDSFPRVAEDLAAMPGQTGFLAAEIDGAVVKPLAGANSDHQFAVGSTFKLYVLDELAAQISAGKRRWADVVPLSHLSFSSAATGNWQINTPVTVQTLANWMISVSDNGAADTLIHLLGRDRIEARMRAAGHANPSRNTPFLTTVEAFALKGDNFARERDAFVGGDDAAQRGLIDRNSDRLVLSNVDGVSFVQGPRFIEDLEWFASPNDIARLMIDLRSRRSETAMAALAIKNGVGPVAAEPWCYLGYKGGSENGVISMSLLGQRKSDGKWMVVTASWNNAAANVDTNHFVALVTRLLDLAAKQTPSR